MDAGGGKDHWGGAASASASGAGSSSSRSKMARLKNAVTPDNRGKSKAGLNGVGMSGGKGGGGGSNVNDAKCAAGVIENVCLLGAPVGASTARWERVARIVHGRIVNGYSKSDIILGLVFRAKSLSLSVSGIQKVGKCGRVLASFVCVPGGFPGLSQGPQPLCLCHTLVTTADFFRNVSRKVGASPGRFSPCLLPTAGRV